MYVHECICLGVHVCVCMCVIFTMQNYSNMDVLLLGRTFT